MKVNLPQQYPTAQVPKSGKAIARQEQAAGSIAPTQKGSNAYSTQRPTRISREGEAQALYVYDSLANYKPRTRNPAIDVYV